MSNCGDHRKRFFLAVNTGFVENALPDQRCYDFYVDRSGNGLHCAIVGNVVIPGGVGSNNVCAGISHAAEWRRLAEGISAQGALPGIQLSSAWPGFTGMRGFTLPSGEDRLREYQQAASSLSLTYVRMMFESLTTGTESAVSAGFRHVQLHAGHGYLFNLLLDQRFSQYFEQAHQLTMKWAKDLASAGIESSIRFSMYTGHPALDEQGQVEFVDSIVSLPIDYFDASAGFYNFDKRLIYPTTEELLASRLRATLDLAMRHPAAQFIGSGKATARWDDSHPPNLHVGICRDLIANPNFLLAPTDGCRNHMKCHYFSRNHPHLTCGRWISSNAS
jgi:NADPH2 dehydrogenase